MGPRADNSNPPVQKMRWHRLTVVTFWWLCYCQVPAIHCEMDSVSATLPKSELPKVFPSAATSHISTSEITAMPPILSDNRILKEVAAAVASLPSPKTSQCPANCECKFHTPGHPFSAVACNDLGLTHLPWDIPPVIASLTLRGNNLGRLLARDFVSLTHLSKLVLSSSDIQSVESSTFRNFSRLAFLDLSQNVLKKLPNGLFKPLQNLVVLNLSGNSLQLLEAGAYTSLQRLQVLDLSQNSIWGMAPKAFEGLDMLETLRLSRNNFTVLSSNTFAGLFHLSNLYLDHNSLGVIEPNTFGPLTNLKVLSLSHNSILRLEPSSFSGLRRLTSLSLTHNHLTMLPERFTKDMWALSHLDLNANFLMAIHQNQFYPGHNLMSIDLGGMPLLTTVLPDAFFHLPSLRQVNFSGCPALTHVNPYAFRNSTSMEVLDLSGCGLRTLHRTLLATMPALRTLRLQGNKWACDCNLIWLTGLENQCPQLTTNNLGVRCSSPTNSTDKNIFDQVAYEVKDCSNATISHYIPNMSFRVGSTALLECLVEGNPYPAVTWLTPQNHVLHGYQPASESMPQAPAASGTIPVHPKFHDANGASLSGLESQRMQVLKNGHLFISPVETIDAGIYRCLAENALGHQSVRIMLKLNYEALMNVKVVSIMVGLATSIAFTLIMLIVQIVNMAVNRWRWCCCRGTLPPKAKQIRKILESVEHYKTQQLDRLRENYNMQVQRIKDNCTQQMEKLRDSYGSQSERLRDFRDYGTQQIDRMREQYYEQVRRVRDYSTQQMSRVRENYVFQRNRIRKFSAHQLFKLRENYKVQQLHLNKILENLNLENCRTVCARTDSVMFTSEIMDTVFLPANQIPPIPLPGCTHHSNDPGGHLIPPGPLEEFELIPPILPLVPGSQMDDLQSQSTASTGSIALASLFPMPTFLGSQSLPSSIMLNKMGSPGEHFDSCSSNSSSHEPIRVEADVQVDIVDPSRSSIRFDSQGNMNVIV